MTPQDVIAFWEEAGESRWFTKDASFDGALKVRFSAILDEARTGACDQWAETAAGALGLVILLDQFSRNIHRGSPVAFAGDARALSVAEAAILRGWHRDFPAPMAQWFIMPFEHAEDIEAQRRGVALFQAMGLSDMAHWAQMHLDIIAKFGRFPHRNAILGRASSPEEMAFLKAGGFSG